MEKKGLLLVMAVAIMATMLTGVAAEAQNLAAYWQGYDLGYQHGWNRVPRQYQGYQGDFLSGYDTGHIDGWYHWPRKVPMDGYGQADCQNGYYQNNSYQDYNGNPAIVIPVPMLPPPFGKIFGHRHHR